MTNQEIADVFAEIADLLHIQGGDRYRIRSFRRSARLIENLPEPAYLMVRYNTLQKVPGIGEGTVHRVKQILRTGTCDDHRQLRTRLPAGLRDMLDVKGLGARTIRRIYHHLKIGSVDELEVAARTGLLTRVPRLGIGFSERILHAIAVWRRRTGKVPFATARREGERIVEALQGLPAVQRVALTGSVRRGKALIGDLDVLVAADERLPVAERFCRLPNVEEVLIRGEGRCSVRLASGQQCDLRIVPPECWGAGLHYFTGSKLHNINVRTRSLRWDIKISDHGIFKKPEDIRLAPGTTEEEIFAAARLPWIPPELRENLGEVEAGAEGKLPRLIEAEDLRGDLHMHTRATDGTGTIEEMVEAARKIGLEYIAITDHTEACTVANGQDAGRLAAQMKKIREIAERTEGIRLLAGAEVDILPDGSLDLDEDLLRQLDWVIASVHGAFDMDANAMTRRIIRAMDTGIVDCIGHPSNRRLGLREANELDMEPLLRRARKLGVALEVNGNPGRMDLQDVHCRMAREFRVPLCINTDSHAPEHLARREFGLLTARRGWVEPQHVLNTQPWAVIAERRRERLRTGAVAVSPGATFAPRAEPPAAGNGNGNGNGDGRGDGEPTDDSGDEAASIVARVDEAEVDALLAAFAERPIDEQLRERIQEWMERGEDEAIEQALGKLGDNPMQVAFGLLAGGDSL